MFKTDFICILTAGHTVDGREIAQEILDQIAETYNPETYNARINIDHSSYSSKLGSVLAVKVDGNKLLAQLKPNDFFLYLIQQGQYLHTSCEIVMDFAKTGKAYLTGLAVTDEPASLGTTELHLSNKQSGTQLFNTDDGITPPKPTLLNKLLNKKDDEMSDKATLEMLSQMQKTNAEQTVALTELASGMTLLTEKLSVKPETEEKPDGDKNESAELKEVKEQLSTLASKFETQGEELTGFKETLSKMTDEQDRDEATGGDKDDEEEIL
ncbi:GPO family capsid scaffolding protein [Psychromonas hadalis]|uniref:GPO family capsid scaffolding protein n=1 Tax=Psychromonas hadalis TaxID=211669 RepID=UPI0003B796AB|nr:GPO family capsid scaffolding protein [Psychromonas hadalis]